MTSNPFQSPIFISKWLDFFYSGKKAVSFESIADIDFVKHRLLPFYFNVGATMTKGISYTLSPTDDNFYKHKTLLLYDVVGHQDILGEKIKKLRLLHLPQYMGYLCNLEAYNSVEEYVRQVISKSSQRKFRSYLKKLENEHSVSSTFYGKGSSDEQIKYLFGLLNQLLQKRFAKKKKHNNNLAPKEWDFHYQFSKQLIKAGKAGLFVIEANNQPIFITLMYFSDKTAIDVIRVFDTDYAQYRPGSIGNIKQIDWCIKNGYSILDFSKGHFEYKERWSNTAYFYEYHIYYDRNSIKARSMAYLLYGYYRLKDLMREIKLDIFWQKMMYRLK